MSRSAGIQIVDIWLPVVGRFTGYVDFAYDDAPYHLESDKGHIGMSVARVLQLGRAAGQVRRRFQQFYWHGIDPAGRTDANDAARRAAILKWPPANDDITVLKLEINSPVYSKPHLIFEFSGTPEVGLDETQGGDLIREFDKIYTHARNLPGGGNSYGLAASGPTDGDDILRAAHVAYDRRAGW